MRQLSKNEQTEINFDQRIRRSGRDGCTNDESVVSSIMGLFPAAFVRRLKDRGIAWFACVTTLAEALEAERAGADAAVA